MPTDDRKAPPGAKDASGHEVAESAPTVSDHSYPKGRNRGEFGTHGGRWRGAGQSPKKDVSEEK